MPDWWEIKYGLNPIFDDSGLDPDLDGATNLEEYSAGTHPNDYGLRWSVEEDDTFSFSLYAEFVSSTRTETVNEGVLVQVETIPSLPDMPSTLDYILGSTYLSVWASNLSMCNLDGFFLIGGVPLAYITPAIPYGNWTFFSEIIAFRNGTLEGGAFYRLVDTTTKWGFILIIEDELVSENVWFKSDGTLSRVSVELNVSATESFHIRLMRSGGIFPGDQSPLLVIGVAGLGIAALVFFVIWKRRGATP
jgi:hypothetical protein